jgi:hypothetical protein
VVHDGIDTQAVAPDRNARMVLDGVGTLSRADEVITFVARNLEPYRGYHVFMRALPALLRQRPQARVLIVGANGTSYGASPSSGTTWQALFAGEARAQMPVADWARVQEVCTLLESPDLRQRLGAAARSSVVARYDLKTVCLPRQLEWIEGLA